MTDTYDSRSLINHNHHNNDVFYFSHIPKTGGTSFTVILDRFFHQTEIFKPQLWWEVGNLESVRKKGYKCFRGHFGMGGHALSDHELKTLTVLRDPLRMAYSAYEYVKRESNTSVHEYVVENNLTFEEFLLDPKTRNLAQNRMIKSLSFGMGIDVNQESLVVSSDNYKFNKRQWNKTVKKMAPQELLQLVKNYLKSCVWVGILEDFELSLSLLCYQLSWPNIGPTEKLNTHSKKVHISKNAENLVRQMNELDYELYDYARHLMNAKIKTTFPKQQTNHEELAQIIDDEYQKKHKIIYDLASLEKFIYDFSMPLLGQNWHRREWSEVEQAYFRWTGPEEITNIDLWITPQNCQVKLEYINVSDLELLKKLTIKVNDVNVNWHIKSYDRVGTIWFFCSEDDIQKNGLLRLKMKTASLDRHKNAFNSDDSRHVGLAIKSIVIKKLEHSG